jgi:hypothetical protein
MNGLMIFGGLLVFVVGLSAHHAVNVVSLGGIALMGVGIGRARARYKKARGAREREESELRAYQLRVARGEVPPPAAGGEPPPMPPINLN